MTLQEQVARRRAERARQERHAVPREDGRPDAAAREAAVGQLAADLSAAGLPVVQNGEQLALEPAPPKPIDVAGLKRSKLQELLDREARDRWTAGENWLVISLVSGGVALIHLGGLGFVPLILGLWRRNVIMERYRAQVLDQYPELAAELTPEPA